MHMLHIGRSTISICGSHQDQGGVDLLVLSKEALLGQGLLTLWASLFNFPWSTSFPGGGVPNLHAICEHKA